MNLKSPPFRRFAFAAAAAALLGAFPRAPLSAAEPPPPALVRADPARLPQFEDPGDRQAILDSLGHSLEFYRQLPPGATLYFGRDKYSLQDAVDTLESFRDFLSQPRSAAELNRFIRREFRVYRSVGAGPRKEVTYSSYYEVTLQAALAPSAEYRYPIYARPPDLVDADLDGFWPPHKGERIAGRADGRNLVPYYTREEIDSRKALQDKGLEIAWAKNPLDISFLQIQGSGWMEVPGGTQTYHIRYAGDNGRPFRSIGLSLIEEGVIPKAKFSKEWMVDYLNGLGEAGRQAVLNRNPRYIFFELTSATTPTRGSLMVALTPEHSVASDPSCYPQGALAWIHTRRPTFDAQGKAAGTEPLKRFVLNQDEGGAIKGPGRIDFFSGRGQRAEATASHLWYPGELYFFIKKPR